jgi:DNA-binding transcriptional LysR family regulator
MARSSAAGAPPAALRRAAPAAPPAHWDDLQVFLAVHGAGAISAAARRLGVNHSTVLRRIAALEGALGARLFDRLPGGYALTQAGQALADRLAGVAEQVDGAVREVAGLDEQVQGPIRLTTTDTLVDFLMPVLAAFGARHPGVQLQLVVNNGFSSLTRREADVAVRGTAEPPGNLVGRRVGAIQTAIYAARAVAAARERRTGWDDLRFVAPDESLAHLAQAHWLAREVPAARVAMRVDSLLGMVQAVRRGVGAGMLLCPLAEGDPGLVRLAPPDPALDTPIWILTHPDLRQVARMRAFTQALFEALSTDPRLVH